MESYRTLTRREQQQQKNAGEAAERGRERRNKERHELSPMEKNITDNHLSCLHFHLTDLLFLFRTSFFLSLLPLMSDSLLFFEICLLTVDESVRSAVVFFLAAPHLEWPRNHCNA